MTTGKVKGIIANLVTVVVDGPVSQNEICYISVGETRLMAEVIKVVGENVYVQVFESTRGMKVGNNVEFTGHMLEVTLGPGLLSRNYDGLQNDLNKLTGVFLKRGEYNFPLDQEKLWKFEPIAKVGDKAYCQLKGPIGIRRHHKHVCGHSTGVQHVMHVRDKRPRLARAGTARQDLDLGGAHG